MIFVKRIINDSLYFNEFSFEAPDIKAKDKLNVIEMKFEKSKKNSIKLKLLNMKLVSSK